MKKSNLIFPLAELREGPLRRPRVPLPRHRLLPGPPPQGARQARPAAGAGVRRPGGERRLPAPAVPLRVHRVAPQGDAAAGHGARDEIPGKGGRRRLPSDGARGVRAER